MTETIATKTEQAAMLLPERLRRALGAMDAGDRENISELRIRRGRYFSAVISGRERYISPGGELSDSPEAAAEISGSDIEHVFRTAFRGSVHAFPRELAEGFITCPGGNRAGFCGSAVFSDGAISSVKDISSINIRIAREIVGCSAEILRRVFSGGLCSLMIASPPCGGKTTILRDLCRALGERHKISLIDERSEIAAVSGGVPQNDIGGHTDVFSGYTKAEAIMTSMRVMSPDMIICDEIGAPSDAEALSYAANSGVKLICTSHAPTLEELKRRPVAGRLISEGVFDRAAILGTGTDCGRLIGLYDLEEGLAP